MAARDPAAHAFRALAHSELRFGRSGTTYCKFEFGFECAAERQSVVGATDSWLTIVAFGLHSGPSLRIIADDPESITGDAEALARITYFGRATLCAKVENAFRIFRGRLRRQRQPILKGRGELQWGSGGFVPDAVDSWKDSCGISATIPSEGASCSVDNKKKRSSTRHDTKALERPATAVDGA